MEKSTRSNFTSQELILMASVDRRRHAGSHLERMVKTGGFLQRLRDQNKWIALPTEAKPGLAGDKV